VIGGSNRLLRIIKILVEEGAMSGNASDEKALCEQRLASQQEGGGGRGDEGGTGSGNPPPPPDRDCDPDDERHGARKAGGDGPPFRDVEGGTGGGNPPPAMDPPSRGGD
jgi:hypothetical protein